MLVRTLYFTLKLDLSFCFALVHERGSCYGIEAGLKLATSNCTFLGAQITGRCHPMPVLGFCSKLITA